MSTDSVKISNDVQLHLNVPMLFQFINTLSSILFICKISFDRSRIWYEGRSGRSSNSPGEGDPDIFPCHDDESDNWQPSDFSSQDGARQLSHRISPLVVSTLPIRSFHFYTRAVSSLNVLCCWSLSKISCVTLIL